MGYDSFANPSLNFRPEELDRLDASHFEPDSPNDDSYVQRFRNLEASINGTLNGLRTTSQLPSNWPQNNNFETSPALPNLGHQPFTPPSSQPFSIEKKPTGGNSFMRTLSGERDQALEEMRRICDQRVEMMRRDEADRFKRLDVEYKQQIQKLQQDLDGMLFQHQQVIKLKNEVESGLQTELEIAKRDLRKEKEKWEMERERLQRTIRELKEKIRELERRGLGGRSRTVSFSADVDDYSGYQRRLGQLQRDNDVKIASLVRQFEKEKQAALEILKTKVRAELGVLIPKIKEQCHRTYSDRIQGLRESLARQFRGQYEETLRRMKEEHSIERRLWQRQTRDQLEYAKAEIVQKLKSKYELRIMDIKNECERRILDRLRRRDTDYSDNDESFV